MEEFRKNPPPTHSHTASKTADSRKGTFVRAGICLRAMRWSQWIKNILIFLPLFFSHKWGNTGPALQALVAFIAFSAGASAIYLINDLLDLEADRQHPKRSMRPIAAGLISPRVAMILAGALLLAGLTIAFWLPLLFLQVFGLYLVTALSYSLGLKRVVLLDAMMLAGFYTLRIFAGSVATGVVVSNWLLLFSMFFFLSLAFQKRLSELQGWSEQEEPLRRRGYLKVDLEHISMMGTGAGYLAVLVLALYIQSPDVTIHYARPGILWWICPCLLYWMSRLWLLAGRGMVTEDAIAFAFHDKASYVVGLLVVVVLFLAKPI